MKVEFRHIAPHKYDAFTDFAEDTYRPYPRVDMKTICHLQYDYFHIFDEEFVKIKWEHMSDGCCYYTIQFSREEDEMLFLLLTNDGIEI